MAFERRRRSLLATTFFIASLACGAGIVGCGSDDTTEETPMEDAGDDGDVASSDTGGGAVDSDAEDTGTIDSTVTDSGADTRDSATADARTDATARDSAATDSGQAADSEGVDSAPATDTMVDDSAPATDTMVDDSALATDTMTNDTMSTADTAVPDGVVVDAVNDVGGACTTACDCEPGFACISNKCQVGVVAVYCCSATACPTNAVCQSTNGQYNQCTDGDAGFDARFDTAPDAAGFCGNVNCQNTMTCSRIGCGTCASGKCTAP